MRIAYIGNFVVDHSTESHVRKAFLAGGHSVVRIQENRVEDWEKLIDRMAEVDMVLWTTTHTYAEKIGPKLQVLMLGAARKAGVPTVAYHLDRWHGLDRENALYTSPYFHCDYVVTANGGSDWAAIGVNHTWLPPAVSLPETALGKHIGAMASDLAFVGSWRTYHSEWTHRMFLVDWLRHTYPHGCNFWPLAGQQPIRGEALRNLYASVKIVVGDSCLYGGLTHYWSDRIPETIGRGGFLLHPNVEGLEDHFKIGTHLDVWDIGDWDALQAKIEHYLSNPEEAHKIAMAGRDWVIEHHTYEVRAAQILDIVGLA